MTRCFLTRVTELIQTQVTESKLIHFCSIKKPDLDVGLLRLADWNTYFQLFVILNVRNSVKITNKTHSELEIIL